MKKILIIGKRGFLGRSLFKYLRKKYRVSFKGFDQIKKMREIKNFNFIINASINKNYIKKAYQEKFDNDLKISSIIDKKIKYVFISTRKIYEPKVNIKENSKIKPVDFYAKNKLVSEKKLSKRLNKNLIILRVSNIIGEKKNLSKNLHYTFIDHFISNVKKGFVYDNGHNFKDFISIDKFCQIIHQILKKNLSGTYNVSIGQKIFLNELISWLNRHNNRNIKIKKIVNNKKESFYLNNKKLMRKIEIKNTKLQLKNYCLKLSKKLFS